MAKTFKLVLNPDKVNIAMANACLNPYDVCQAAGVGYDTFRRIINGTSVKPKTAGHIAKALNCKVEDLI